MAPALTKMSVAPPDGNATRVVRVRIDLALSDLVDGMSPGS